MPNMRNAILESDPDVLRAALRGYQLQQSEIDRQVAAIRERLNAPAPATHQISPEGRARIAEAQRRRWANAKQEPKTQKPAVKGRRVFSAETRARMADSQRKRFARLRKGAAAA